jgi:hypothetical protein
MKTPNFHMIDDDGTDTPMEPCFYILDADDNVKVTNDMWEWFAFVEQKDRLRVARTEVSGVEISTVFLPMLWFNDKPLSLFETMIFGGKLDHYQIKYKTMAEAKLGHDQVVEQVKQAEASD